VHPPRSRPPFLFFALPNQLCPPLSSYRELPSLLTGVPEQRRRFVVFSLLSLFSTESDFPVPLLATSFLFSSSFFFVSVLECGKKSQAIFFYGFTRLCSTPQAVHSSTAFFLPPPHFPPLNRGCGTTRVCFFFTIWFVCLFLILWV